ncbi:MAG TPA: hypothetical protein DDY68_02805 [Porphyromonadaceae bacterium]|nr:hypothetical protein [Porphyromonadaceae bacterium]
MYSLSLSISLSFFLSLPLYLPYSSYPRTFKVIEISKGTIHIAPLPNDEKKFQKSALPLREQ